MKPQTHLSSPKKVLILDDESEMGELCRDFLESLGFYVSVFQSPKKAIEALSKTSFDVVIAEINTPEMNGLTFMREAHRRNPTMPVILMTSFANRSAINDVTRKGAFDFLTKPFNLARLKHAVDNAAKTKHNLRSV